MKLIFLSEKFYNDHAQCDEILQKRDWPYACLVMKIGGVTFAIPFRHNIKHRYAFMTYGTCGLDYTKAVVIRDGSDIADGTPTVDRKEWDRVRRCENDIFYSFRQYVRQYRRAMAHRDNPRNSNLLKYSTLQYFEQYISHPYDYIASILPSGQERNGRSSVRRPYPSWERGEIRFQTP